MHMKVEKLEGCLPSLILILVFIIQTYIAVENESYHGNYWLQEFCAFTTQGIFAPFS